MSATNGGPRQARRGSGDPRHDVLSRLKGVVPGQNGHDWSALCPAHEDRKRSLSVRATENGTILLKCHSGCSAKSIVEAIGLSMADLFPDTGPGTSRGTIIKTYDYVDEKGRILFQAVRFHPKDFRQRRPDGKGGWTWKLGDVRRVLYRLPDIIGAPKDQTVFVVEGEKDADRLAQENIVATTCAMGAGKWRSEYNAALAGRPVVILPDNDEPGRKHAEQVAASLRRVAASVKVVPLPGLPPKGDVSDWLENGGALSTLLELAEATPVQPAGALPAEPKAEGGPAHPDESQAADVAEAEDDPHRLARLFFADHTTPVGRALHYWREEWYVWTASAYRTMPEKEIRARLCERVKREFDQLNRSAIKKWEEAGGLDQNGHASPKPVARKVTTRLTADVQHALTSIAVLPSTLTTPTWLGEAECPAPFAAAEVLACRNALVYLPAYGNGQSYRVAPTPLFFSQNALDYDFDPKAPRPQAWLDFLAQLWPDDQQAVQALQEWFAYCLLPDTSQQKILMIVGPKRSGKGTIARVLRGLVGMDNTAGPTLASLGTNFGLWPLLDKTLAIISDARLSGRSDAAVIVERLLSISGEDAQTVDRKNMRPVTAKLAVRFVILTNELPRLNDPSGALVGRMVLLRQMKSWYGKEDPRLTDKLLRELPGILLWAIDGWHRLHARGHFVQPSSSLKVVRELEDLSSPIGAFLREHCVIGPSLEAPVRALFDRWRRWCDDVGQRDAGTEQTFGRDLRAAIPGLDDRRPHHSDGRRFRVYVGIGLRPEEAPDWQSR
jgi:P4 family phage/plasmid primase-like protien